MLGNRTRTVTTKQALMADQTPVSSIFGSPRFINGGFPKKSSEIETITPSPTSILDTKPFSPIGYHHKIPSENPNIFRGKKHEWQNENPKRIGLALVDSLNDKPESSFTQSVTRKVLFGSKLEIQIPKTEFEPSTQTPKSPGDFGTKTRNSPYSKSPFGNSNFKSPKIVDISATEMELSEEYTCVIAHGPSPRTVHIYDDCVLESCNGVVSLSELKRQLSLPPPRKSSSGFDNFLSYCCTCKKSLDQGKDIYMYRGEKGFCSHECRFKEMLSDEESNLKK